MKKFLASLALLGLITSAVAQDTQALETRLSGKSVAEKAQIKSQEIVKVAKKGEFTEQEIKVDIISIQEIEGGIEVMARAWKDGKQLGFGEDGSVDIERFKFYIGGSGRNSHLTHIVVPDPSGDISVDYSETDPITREVREWTERYREDPEENMRITLLDTIKIVGKEGTAVKSGKIGNTTSTFYSSAGTTSPCDGYVAKNDNASWSTTRDASDGASASTTATAMLIQSRRQPNTEYAITRSILSFDLSTIDDVISSATLSVKPTSISNGDNDGYNYLVVTSATPNATNAVATGDYDQLGSTAFSSTKSLNDLSTGTYADLSFTASGISYAQGKTGGVMSIGMREGHDMENHTIKDNADNGVFASSADDADSNKHPKLVVEHSGAPAATGIPPQLIIW